MIGGEFKLISGASEEEGDAGIVWVARGKSVDVVEQK